MDSYFAGHKELNFLNPEAHKIFRRLVEDIKIGIFMADARDKIFYTNKAFAQTFELQNCSESLGKDWGQVCFSDFDRREQFLAELNAVGAVKEFETIHIFPHGVKSHLLITANYIYSDQGERIGLQGFMVNISNQRKLEEDLFVKHQKLEQILNFCNTLGDIFKIEELTKYVVYQTAQILDVKRCSLMFVDPVLKELYVNASWGLADDMVPKARVRIGDPVAGVIALQNQALLVEDIEDHSLFKCQNKKIYTQRSFMGAPLFYNKKLIGILNVSEKQGRFSKIDLKVLETIAQQAAVSINKTQALNAFEQLSQTDPMTGLLNYRSFVGKMEEEIQRAKRYGSPLSFMMIDVDNFKTYNDTKGHPEGDKILKRLAEIFRANLRVTEFICRYGGDEFGIIFPQTDALHAVVAGKKIQDLAAKEFAKAKISISIGVAQFQAGSSTEALIKQADESLYESKKNGRNHVTLNHSGAEA